MIEMVNASKEFLKKYITEPVDVAIVLGSGLMGVVEALEDKVEIEYKNIPYFNETSVAGHSSKLVFGKLGDKSVVCMVGRLHFYEGFSMKQITFPLYVFRELGVKNLILTNSCGGINDELVQPGDILVLNDFINFMPSNPLMGVNDDYFGPRFPDMTEPYSLELRNLAEDLSKDLGIIYKEGVYTSFSGPCYETKAEIRMLKGWGSDAVGMSTVPETIVGNYLGMNVIAFATITNLATGIQKMKHSHANVVKVAGEASEKLRQWIELLVKNMSL